MRQKAAIKRNRDGRPTQEYEVWHSMRSRCINPNRSDYHLYGGRGVRCDLTFEDFLAEVGPRPSERHYLVMKDKNGHYAKGNIKWVPLEQWRRGKPLSAELRLKYQQTKAFHKLTGKRKGTSRFIGVCWYSSDRFWHAQIAVAGLFKSGVSTSLRHLFAQIRLNECNGDLSPIEAALVKVTVAQRGMPA